MLLLAAGLVAAAILVVPPGGRASAAERLAGVAPPRGSPRPGQQAHGPAKGRGHDTRQGPRAVRGCRAVAAFAGFCCVVLVGGFAGLGVGVVVAVCCDRLLRRLEPVAVRRRRRRLSADLPVAADLLAACLMSGSTLPHAADSVADALGEPLAGPLHEAVASIRLGAEPREAWRSLAAERELEPLARSLERAVDSGAALAETLTRVARDQRENRRRAATAAAAKIGVRAALPLGVCFLPAFVLLGVLPVVGGIAGRVLGG